jgi:S1-C subfamily serine protease
MKKVLISSLVVLVLCTLSTSQTKRTPKSTVLSRSTSLSAQEVARRTLRSVVVVIGRGTNGTITLGSGFFVAPRIIATNLHVVEDASEVTAKLLTEDRSEYRIDGSVAIDQENDLVLLQIGSGIGPGNERRYVTPPAGQPLPLGGGPRSEIGDTVYVAGNPEGYVGTFSPGIVSALRGIDYIQITAPISPGSSGGPVMNQRGEVIGVASLFHGEGQNLNFAIPISKLVSLLGKIARAKPLIPRTRPDLPSLIPGPTPRQQARTELLLSVSDTLFLQGSPPRTDTRIYRFHLSESATIKGGFSARGKIYVRILSSSGYAHYGSGEISSDSIEKTLPVGTYILEVSLLTPGGYLPVGVQVDFSVNLTAFYDH